MINQLNNGQSGAAAGGGTAPGATAPATTPAPGATNTDGAGSNSNTSAAPTTRDLRSKGARAAERAQARLAAEKKGGDKNTPASTTSAQQAPGGEKPAGASTEAKPGEAGTAKPDATADGGKQPDEKGQASSGSTVTAPENWPKEDREAFEKLPEEGRQLLMGIHKKMSAGLNHAFMQLAEERDRIGELTRLEGDYEKNPKAVIAELAKRANLEIFFERPGPEDEIPEEAKNDPKKYADWITDRATKKAQKIAADDIAKRENAAAAQKASDDLSREFKDAQTAHADFVSHRPAVLQLLKQAPALTVEQAYRLVTYDALTKLVSEGEAAKRELTKLQAEAEHRKKEATRLTAGGADGAAVSGEDRLLSPAARAYNRAKQKRAASGNRRV